MDQPLVMIKDNELYTTTWELSRGFGVDHRAVKRLLERYKTEFEEFGVITTALQKPPSKKGGRPTEEFDLCEGQAMYMTTLFTNNARVRKFKLQLTQAFLKQRKLLMKLMSRKENAEWLEKRASGKIERRLETDVIQKFVEYAKEQGSKSAEKYYMIISKMENQSLFALDFVEQKFPNLRDVLEGFALDSLKMADRIVGKTIKDGMDKKLPYREIYPIVKHKVETFAEAIGKTPLSVALISGKAIPKITEVPK